jgi:hypothetical protein
MKDVINKNIYSSCMDALLVVWTCASIHDNLEEKYEKRY